jgi:hypothetical protein
LQISIAQTHQGNDRTQFEEGRLLLWLLLLLRWLLLLQGISAAAHVVCCMTLAGSHINALSKLII